MKAKFPNDGTTQVLNGKWPDGNKEQIGAFQVVALRKGMFLTPITVRLFMSRSHGASTVYCSFWSHNNNTGQAFNGFGKASGWGYHRASAALAAAIKSAGIELSEPIDGRGESAMRQALTAIAKAYGYRKFTIVEL